MSQLAILLLFLFGSLRAETSARRQGVLTEVFCNFPHSAQAFAGVTR